MTLITVCLNFMIGCNDYFLNGPLYGIKFALKTYECKYFRGNNSFLCFVEIMQSILHLPRICSDDPLLPLTKEQVEFYNNCFS